LAAAGLLYKLVRFDYDEETALRTIKYLFLFPTTFILSGVFSEALYLFLILLCFYTARRQKWFLTAASSFLVALCRPPGVFILLPLLYEYSKQIEFKFSKLRSNVLLVLLPPIVGLGLFSYLNYCLTGDPLGFMHIQAAWGRSLTNPLTLLFHHILSKDINIFFAANFTLGCIILLLVNYKKLLGSYFLYAGYSIFIPLSTGLMSMPRYMSVVFPLAISIALLSKKESVDQVCTIGLCLLQGFLMVFWSNGFPLLM
jgi:hypothetical protein